MNRLGVLGTFVWDRIWTREDARRGEPFTSWGGIAYSLAAAAAACPPGWEVVPVARVGADLEEEARGFLAGLPGVRVEGASLRVVAEPNNRVELFYTDEARRGERLTGGVSGWGWGELEPALEGLDALYLNFISGFEMELEAAERLRASFGGPTYADLHSLFLGCPGAGTRSLRPLPEWEEWAGCFDAVQLNEDELGTLGAPRGFPEGAAPLLRAGAGVVAVTLGEKGAAVARREGFPEDPARWSAHRGLPEGAEAPCGRVHPAPALPGDPTGAGDVWGATLFCGLLSGVGVDAAVKGAHRAAARKLSHRGASGLYAHLRGG